MHINEYANIYTQETTHFFYVANHHLLSALLQDYLSSRPDSSPRAILDAGCGTGGFLTHLAKLGQAIGCDLNPTAIKIARTRGVTATTCSLQKLPYRNQSFDIVTCIDVINHQSLSISRALSELYRVLKPGGLLLVRVSAPPWLHLNHDTYVHMSARLDKPQLQKLLLQANFSVLKLSYMNMALLPVALLRMLWEYFSPSAPSSIITQQPAWLNASLAKILLLELPLLRLIDLPFGLGLVAVCKK